MLKTSRSYLAHLVNQTDEGKQEDGQPRVAGRAHSGQFDLFGDDEA
jgi:hypothetical protein